MDYVQQFNQEDEEFRRMAAQAVEEAGKNLARLSGFRWIWEVFSKSPRLILRVLLLQLWMRHKSY